MNRCKLCNKQMELISWDSFGGMTCEEFWKCECGYSTELSYGAYRELFKGREIND